MGNPGQLANRVAIVTGSSRGIGRAVAKAFAREGAQVVLNARHLAPLRQVAREIMKEGGDCWALRSNVYKPVEVKRLVREAMNRYGKIDILVNNAGILTPRAPLHEVKLSDWQASLDVNLTGYFLTIKYVLPIMLRRGSGVVINVSSGAGRSGSSFWGPYAVSKFGVEGLTRVLASEVRKVGIRVYAVNPGATRTAMRAQAYPEENILSLTTPEEVAELFVFLASPRGSEIAGESVDYREWRRRYGRSQ